MHIMTAQAAELQTDFIKFGPWTVTSVKGHILQSEGEQRSRFEESIALLPQVPEMVFADNVLRINHEAGFGIQFNALDALSLVDTSHDTIKVAASEVWKAARADCEHIHKVIKPFDWTFTTDYKGTLQSSDKVVIQTEITEAKIDMEKLKQREKILFYADVPLFEDELADSGTSVLGVKIRVMPTSFFILLRFFMRVDDVIIRVNETRIYHEAGQNFMLREYISKESKISDLKIEPHLINDPNEVSPLLPVIKEICERLTFPGDS